MRLSMSLGISATDLPPAKLQSDTSHKTSFIFCLTTLSVTQTKGLNDGEY
jgi:hypothetical protein